MGDLQLYGMNQSGLGGIPYFQATQFEFAINLRGLFVAADQRRFMGERRGSRHFRQSAVCRK